MISSMNVQSRQSASLYLFLAIWLLATALPSFAADLTVVSLRSNSMNRDLAATVILPSSYHQPDRQFPAIYLLHGFGGDHTVWPRLAPLGRLADSLQIIFVCPDGKNSWYIDSPRKKRSLFETWIVHELIPQIDTRFRTIPKRECRAIMGSSMGGHGAMLMLERHPDLFSAACSIDGIMDLSAFPRRWELSGLLGPLHRNRPLWHDLSSINGISSLKSSGALLIFDCGQDDFAMKGNRRMNELLTGAGIPHEFKSEPGRHESAYVKKVAAGYIIEMAASLKVTKLQSNKVTK